MRKAKIVVPASIFSLLLLVVLAFSLTKIYAATGTNSKALTRSTQGTTQHINSSLIVAAQPTRAVTPQATLKKPTTVTQSTTAQPTATQAVTTTSSSGGSDRYFPASMSAAAMKAAAANLTKQQVKALIELQVNKNWSVIQSKLGFTTEAQAYAFFLGMATRESTLDAGLETGSGAGHSYGPIQASEDAYISTLYPTETDVPQMSLYSLTPQNYYDPGIAVHMGIRHLLHFANQAQAAGYTGVQLLRHALIGYNTGYIQTTDQSLLQQYSDEIGALAGWYLDNGHLYDSAFTWTGSSAVDRSQPWGWY